MDVAKFIDHTNINKDATEEDIKKSCQEAKEYGFRGMCVNPEWTRTAKNELKGTGTKLVTLIDPPMGLSSHQERVKMCQKAKEDGSDENDIVINVIDIKYERFDKVLKDLKEICQIAPTKVIIGSGYLTDEEIKKASEIVKQSGAICVKTATEKDPLDSKELEEKAKHVRLMRATVGPDFLVKASGSIKTLEAFKLMREAGADIIGASSGVAISKSASHH